MNNLSLDGIETISGQTFNYLTPIDINIEKSIESGYICWNCKCKCGKDVVIKQIALISGKSKSCGCYRREYALMNVASLIEGNKKHNKIYTNKEYGFSAAFFNNKPGECFYFDTEDMDIATERNWYKSSAGYVTSTELQSDGKRKTIFFHRKVMEKYYDMTDKVTDHINQNKVDDRKSNIRPVSSSENNRNVIDRGTNTGHRNISKRNNKYVVSVTINKQHCINTFNTEKEALAYRNQIYKEHGILDYVYDSKNDFTLGNVSPSGTIAPFIDLVINQPIISPFTIVDENKFYNSIN